MTTETANPTARRTDRRSERTRNSLSRAMFTLLQSNEFRKITVHDICQQARVSRPTFYTYFEDKYTLLYYCVDIFFKELLDSTVKDSDTPREHIETVLGNVGDYQYFIANLLSPAFHSRPEEDTAENAPSLAERPSSAEIPDNVATLYRLGGAILTFAWWAMYGSGIPRKDLVNQIVRLLERTQDK